jgi:Holliday junction resolvase-like predicted endonuclease
VAKLVKKDKDKKVDKTKLLELLSGIEVYLANNKKLQNRAQKIEVVLQAKKYLHSKGAMSKMLMESVALVV